METPVSAVTAKRIYSFGKTSNATKQFAKVAHQFTPCTGSQTKPLEHRRQIIRRCTTLARS